MSGLGFSRDLPQKSVIRFLMKFAHSNVYQGESEKEKTVPPASMAGRLSLMPSPWKSHRPGNEKFRVIEI